MSEVIWRKSRLPVDSAAQELKLSDLSLKELKKAIRGYHALDHKNISISQATEKLISILKYFITHILKWNEPNIFRGRKHCEQSLFTNVQDLVHPRNPVSYGRLNDIGESMFYGASHQDTSILELKPKKGDVITVLESELADPNITPKFMEVGIRELVRKQNHSPYFLERNQQMLEQHIRSAENKVRYELINKFLIDEISKSVPDDQPYKYKGTIAIGQFFTKNNKLVDGMLYPSISRAGADCIAIKPESYLRLYKPKRCFKCTITGGEITNGYTVEVLDHSSTIDEYGNISWAIGK